MIGLRNDQVRAAASYGLSADREISRYTTLSVRLSDDVYRLLGPKDQIMNALGAKG